MLIIIIIIVIIKKFHVLCVLYDLSHTRCSINLCLYPISMQTKPNLETPVYSGQLLGTCLHDWGQGRAMQGRLKRGRNTELQSNTEQHRVLQGRVGQQQHKVQTKYQQHK